MSTLTGQKPKDTYRGLIKTEDSQAVTTEKQLSDGDGNQLPIRVSPTGSKLNGDVRVNGEALTSFVYDQTVADVQWTITHNMAKKPSVTVIDSMNRVVVGEVEYVNDNEVTLRFKYAFKGKAILN